MVPRKIVKIAKYLGFCVYRRSYLVYNMPPTNNKRVRELGQSQRHLWPKSANPTTAVQQVPPYPTEQC